MTNVNLQNTPQILRVADTRYSHVCLEQGINRWTIVEDALHWAILAIREPKNGRIQGKMGEWRLKLCIRVPQVWISSCDRANCKF